MPDGDRAGPRRIGLTSAEAQARLRERPPSPPPRGSRSYADIVRSNVLTVFNAILGTLFVVVLVVGEPQDALFGGVIVANTAIGIAQEIRAKRTLDRLALLAAPRARAWRDGRVTELAVRELVAGDAVHLEPGDQIVADGRLLRATGLALDESLLTGESRAVPRALGEQVLSGAYCVAGVGDYEVEAVGAESFAERLAAEARGTRIRKSPLQQDIDRLLWTMAIVALPLAIALSIALVLRKPGLRAAVDTAAAGVVGLIPEGLVLLASLTFAVAAIRLGRHGALAQRLNAVESLASVDTVCFDKTGTLTDNRLRLVAVLPAPGETPAGARGALTAMAHAATSQNPTMRAIGAALPGEAAAPVHEVPFSSERKWSSVTLAPHGTLILGAPEVLGTALARASELATAGGRHAAAGDRVLLLARADAPPAGESLPTRLAPVALVVLGQGLRDDARATVEYLRAQRLSLKVISGDSVETVRAIALAAGVPDADRAIAGTDLPDEPDALERAAAEHAVFGRVAPDDKMALIAAMTRRGSYVAMVGDGVNDVLALKEARLAIAMGAGSQMAKGVADLVLLSNAFASVPAAVEAGRQVIRNTHRVARLFVAKAVYVALLLVTIGLAPVAFPFLPRHLTLTNSLTIGIPAFFLALASSSGPARHEGFLRRLASFCLPAGAATAAAIAAAYLIVRGPLDQPAADGRTAAVIVTAAVGLAVVIEVERGAERRPVRPWVWALVGSFAAVMAVGLQLSPVRAFFALSQPSPSEWGVIAACVTGGLALLLARRRIAWLARAEAEAPMPLGSPR